VDCAFRACFTSFNSGLRVYTRRMVIPKNASTCNRNINNTISRGVIISYLSSPSKGTFGTE